MKRYRVFYHYYKQKDMMSIHFKGACMAVDRVVCNVRCESARRNRQPRLVMQGWAERVEVKNGVGTIS